MSDHSIADDAKKAADLFVGVLAKALTNRVLDEAFDGQVTMSQLQALRYLRNNEQRLMSDLADGLAISYPAATKTVERLVRKNLVAREGDPADRRVVRVRLTESGAALLEKIDAEINERLVSVLDSLEPDDRSALLRGMRAFVAAALKQVDDRHLLAAICLHCGTYHQDDCPVLAARQRVQAAAR